MRGRKFPPQAVVNLVGALALAMSLYLIVSFSRDLIDLLQKEREMEKTNLRLENLRLENEKVKKQLQEVKSPQFMEKEAREKLNLAKEGETVLILPQNLEEVLSPSQPTPGLNQEPPNWKKWWALFFAK